MTLRKLHRVFFHILIILLPTQLGFHFWPQWAHVLGRRIDYLSPTLYLTDILVLLTLGCWLIEICFRSVNYELGILNLAKKHTFFIHASLCILLFICINIASSLSPILSTYKWLKFLEFGLLGLYIVKTKPSLFTIQNSLFIAVLYSSLIAIVQFYLQHSIGGLIWFLGERTFTGDTSGIALTTFHFPLPVGEAGIYNFQPAHTLRAYGTFPHPNVLGGFLAVILPLLIHGLAYRVSRFRLVYVATIIVGMIALLLTFSRSAIFVGSIGMLYAFFQKPTTELKSKKIGLWNYVIFACITVVFYTIFMFYNSTNESVVVRQQLNASAIEIWKTRPWLGVGIGNFILALPSFLPSKFIYFLQPVHNIYLLLLSEIGIVGIFLICLSIYFYVNHVVRVMNNGKKGKNLIRTSMFMLFLLGLIDHYPLTLQQGQLLLTLLIGLGLVY